MTRPSPTEALLPPSEAPGRETAQAQAGEALINRAFEQLHSAVLSKHPMWYLGGPEKACTLLMLAALDGDGDGALTVAERAMYHAQGERLVESTKNFLLNAGVIAALVLSIVYQLAYEENESLKELAGAKDWMQLARFADLTSFVAMQCAISTAIATVLLSSRLYTQISFWMPNLECQLWLINEAASTTSVLEAAKTAHRPTFEVRRDESRRPLDREQACKNLTIFATLLALALETAVTGTWLDYVGYIPLAVLTLTFALHELLLSRRCVERLNGELRRLVASRPRLSTAYRPYSAAR